MEFIQTSLPEVKLIRLLVHGDERGFFFESYKKSTFIKNGITDDFVQDNHSQSSLGVLRGLHYQLAPMVQAKLVRCVRGRVFDVAVDIRRGSPSFGKWVGYELSEDNKQMLYIPVGFAHGFLTLSDKAELIYKSNNEYSVEHDRGIRFDDPAIGIKWPRLNGALILSPKDEMQPTLANAEINFNYVGKDGRYE
jgi:dTDP-4-dehydrorhamnose 3,5-epimerase